MNFLKVDGGKIRSRNKLTIFFFSSFYPFFFVTGTPVLTGTGTVIVIVQDVNDHNPEFSQSHYRAEAMENAPSGTGVVQVFATDGDAGANSLIRYICKMKQDM